MGQTTSHILMIRPAAFGFNPETVASNSFQSQKDLSGNFQSLAVEEFNAFAQKLKDHEVDVIIEADTKSPSKPDAIFPNNWISTHQGSIILYPMEAATRRLERRLDIVDRLREKFGFSKIVHLEAYESSHLYLEGTGSIIFDHIHQYAFACLSSRTHVKPLNDICKQIGYTPITFKAVFNGKAIYHTNVMLSIGENFAVVCSESIQNPEERKHVLSLLKKIRPVLIDVTSTQMQKFACNILEIKSKTGQALIAMSQTAIDSFTETQRSQLAELATIVANPIPTIENIGGGSARCMLAEIFA